MLELKELTSQFMLRRTQDIISKYLPAKTELILFCKPTPLQSCIYKRLLSNMSLDMDPSCILSRYSITAQTYLGY
jgi:SNF2 family DNA or RNA helicase